MIVIFMNIVILSCVAFNQPDITGDVNSGCLGAAPRGSEQLARQLQLYLGRKALIEGLYGRVRNVIPGGVR